MEQERSIRVFISSTFVDNQSERDILVKRIFPRLRKICEERNVSWSEVDLRWGITEDKINEGKLIPVIIEEITRCKPYFIGILGNRYGYIPSADEFSDNIVESYPWLKDYQGRSITEMEIIHGVFRNQESGIPAFFYIKKQSVNKKIRSDERAALLKQSSLISRIKESQFTWHEYTGSEAMGEMVYKDFIRYINSKFPPEEQPDYFERENNSQLSYAKSRGAIYIGGRRYFEKINSFLRSRSRLMIVDGISGSGKTALLANWFINSRDDTKDYIIFSHFVGATENSSNWTQMLARFIYASCRYLNLKYKIPEDRNSLRTEFKRMLSSLDSKAGKRKFVFVIDALNQLENKEGARELLWLPEAPLRNIYFILSSLPGTSLDILRKREHTLLSINLLGKREKRELIIRYLAQYSKILDTRLVNKIIEHRQSGIPLYLLTLLNEIRIFGKYDELGRKLNNYLQSQTPLELFIKVIERLENDFNSDVPDLVARILTSIYASRKGIEEAELLDVASLTRGERLPIYYWSTLYLSIESSLINHSGLINFSHEYLKKGVWEKYIGSTGREIKIHARLSTYYLEKAGSVTQRIADELPWHLIKSKQYKMLFKLLSDPGFFNWLWKNNRYDLKTYCTFLESNSGFSLARIDKIDPDDFHRNRDYYFNLLSLLYEMSEWETIRLISKPIINNVLKEKDWDTFGRLVFTIGQMMLDGDAEEVDQIMEWTRLAKKHSESPKRKTILINSLLNLAYGYSDQGKNKIAVRYNNQALKLAQEAGDYESEYTSYNNNAVIFNNMGKDQVAMEYYNKVLQIGYSSGDLGAVQLAKGNMAWIYFGWGELKLALDLFIENEIAYTEWGDDEGVAYAKYCKAMIYFEMNMLDESEKLYSEAYETYIRIKDYSWIPAVTGWLGIIAFEKGKTADSLKLMRKAMKIYEKVVDYEYMPSFLADYARVLIETGDPERAFKLLKKAEEMAGSKDYRSALIDVFIVKTFYYLRLNNLIGAGASNKELGKLSNSLQNAKGKIKYMIYRHIIKSRNTKRKTSYSDLENAAKLASDCGFSKILYEIRILKNTGKF